MRVVLFWFGLAWVSDGEESYNKIKECDISQHLAESDGVAGLDGDAGSAGGFGDGI